MSASACSGRTGSNPRRRLQPASRHIASQAPPRLALLGQARTLAAVAAGAVAAGRLLPECRCCAECAAECCCCCCCPVLLFLDAAVATETLQIVGFSYTARSNHSEVPVPAGACGAISLVWSQAKPSSNFAACNQQNQRRGSTTPPFQKNGRPGTSTESPRMPTQPPPGPWGLVGG